MTTTKTYNEIVLLAMAECQMRAGEIIILSCTAETI
jgi:hypothetical protein